LTALRSRTPADDLDLGPDPPTVDVERSSGAAVVECDEAGAVAKDEEVVGFRRLRVPGRRLPISTCERLALLLLLLLLLVVVEVMMQAPSRRGASIRRAPLTLTNGVNFR